MAVHRQVIYAKVVLIKQCARDLQADTARAAAELERAAQLYGWGAVKIAEGEDCPDFGSLPAGYRVARGDGT